MKKKVIPVLMVVFSITSYAKRHGEVEIKGTITHHSAESIAIGDSQLKLTENGTFTYKAATAKPIFLTVRYRNREFDLFAEPNERMAISFDAKDIDNSIKFKGNSPETNRLLFEFSRIDARQSKYFDQNFPEHAELFKKDEESFVKEINLFKRSYLEPLADLLRNQDKINKRFVFEIRKNINFALDSMIIIYPQEHNRITGNRVALSDKTQAVLDAIDLDNLELIGIGGYTEFGKGMLFAKVKKEFRTNEELKKSDNQWLLASFNVIQRIFKNRKVIDFWLFQILNNHIENSGIKNIAFFIDTFNRICLSEEYKTAIRSLVQRELKNRERHLIKTYKTIHGFELDAHIFIPDNLQPGERRPALVQFHGGSWSEGKPDWSFGNSPLGFVNVCIDYRTFERYQTLPFEQVSDAKSAIRWLREHADELHVDENKIIAVGSSAGAHLALCTALLDRLDEPDEDMSVSSAPNALVLNSTPYDLTRWIWFEEFVADKERIKDISPNQNIKRGLPPMLVFHGTDDTVSAPYRDCEAFIIRMKEAGNEVNFYPLEGLGHFIWRSGAYRKILEKAEKEFYTKLGYL